MYTLLIYLFTTDVLSILVWFFSSALTGSIPIRFPSAKHNTNDSNTHTNTTMCRLDKNSKQEKRDAIILNQFTIHTSCTFHFVTVLTICIYETLIVRMLSNFFFGRIHYTKKASKTR